MYSYQFNLICSSSSNRNKHVCHPFPLQLLDCFVIPVLMVLSWFLLKTRYRPIHFVAVTMCLVGVGAMVGADLLAGRDQGSSKESVSVFLTVSFVQPEKLFECYFVMRSATLISLFLLNISFVLQYSKTRKSEMF